MDLSFLNLKFLFYCFIFYYVFKFVVFVYKNLIRKRLNLQKRYGKDSWVLVTGATDGIGKALCIEFARLGFNIILVSRTRSKLDSVAEEVNKINSKVSTHVIEFDFDKRSTLGDYMEIFSNLQEKFDISILINNVGTEQHNTFDRVKINHLVSSINLNIIPQTLLTKLFINKLNNRENGRSAIINLSSFAAEFPFPMKSLYSATKIFNHYLNVGLSEERIHSKIDWISVKPMEVETVLSTTKADGIFVITPKQCANSILDDLGYEEETYTHISHKIQAFILLTFIPRSLLYFVFRNFWFRFFIKRDLKSE